MKKYIGLLLMLFSLEATAQLHMKANLQTNHLWRGIEVADGLVITGDVNYSLCNGLFNLGFWGGTNTRGTYKEFNNHISFQYKGFSLALWDTYNFSTGATYNNKEFFKLQSSQYRTLFRCNIELLLWGKISSFNILVNDSFRS